MSTEVVKAIDELGRTFEEFKSENERRLSQIESKGYAPADIEDKVERISAAVTDLQKVKDQVDTIEALANRPGKGGVSDQDKAKAEHKSAFGKFMRKGDEDGLRALEVNAALTTQSDPDGGFLTGEEIETNIERIQGLYSAMRGLATVRSVGSAVYKKPVNVGGASSGWVGEKEARGETDTPTLKLLEFPTKELYANPAATQSMLDDAEYDIEGWLADEVGIEFSEQEGGAFITGDGVNQPRGILGYGSVVNSSYAWGSVGHVVSGGAADFAASNPSDALISLQHALKSGYRNNATWLMADTTVEKVRKFKDSTGNYIWKPGLEAGSPSTLLGKPVETDDNMPVVAANALSIAYADFRRAYVITDRIGVRVLRDPYTNKPFVHFYTTKRVGGGIQNFEAIKLMKISA
jgi:HK97 family phage major capsid protein